MMLSSIVLSITTLCAVVYAQSPVLSFTSVPNPITDGQPQAITYQTNDTVTPVTITLRKGIPTNLDTVYTLTTTATGGQYIWTPRSDLPNGNDYALQISQGDQVNYFGPFRVQGYTGLASSGAALTSAATLSGNATASLSTGVIGGNASAVAPGTGTISLGTASPIPRNTTFSSATLAATTTSFVTQSTTAAQTSASAITGGNARGGVDMNSALAVFFALGALLMP